MTRSLEKRESPLEWSFHHANLGRGAREGVAYDSSDIGFYCSNQDLVNFLE